MHGKIRKIDETKGFGFITGDDGTERFFHHSGLKGSLRLEDLAPGDQVEFDHEDGPKGPRANNVTAA